MNILKLLFLLAWLCFVMLLFGSAQHIYGQGLPAPFARQQYFTNTGAVCNACTITTSLTGTGTPASVYSDATLLTSFANPMTLNASGRPTTDGVTEATIFLTPTTTYRFVLKTSAGVTIWTVDGVQAPTPTSFSVTAGAIPKGNATGTTIQDSTCLSEAGSTVTVLASCTEVAPLLIGGTGTGSTLALRSTSGAGATDAILFQVGSNGATEAMRITTTGKVGIGTTGPAVDLDVKRATSGGSVYVAINNTSNTASSSAGLNIVTGGALADDPVVLFSITGATNWVLGIDNSDSDKFKISASAALGTSDALTITTAGVVGVASVLTVNTSSTSGSFNTAGKIYWTGGTAEAVTGSAICLAATGEVQTNAAASCTVSSRRFKHDEQVLSAADARRIVMALEPKDYLYNGRDGRHFGFIAEDAEQIDRRLVAYDDEGRPQSFRYEEYTAVLTRVVQHLSERLARLEAR